MDNGGFPPIENIIKKNYKNKKVEKNRSYSNNVNVTDIFNIKLQRPMIEFTQVKMTTIDSL
jgi:hypothetical protein